MALSIEEHGARLYPGAAADDLPALCAALAHFPPDHAGLRLTGVDALHPILSAQGTLGRIAAGATGPSCRPVRAILFDKTVETNWALGWHQDRTIVVRRRIDVARFGPWTIKRGMQHVAPPFDLLQRMVTMRVHLDDVPDTNAPLLIAPGSHRDGRIAVDRVRSIVERRGVRVCTAQAGDIWLYATPILHASDAATQPRHRRVLQIDYAAEDLPGGLEWLGI